MLLQSAGRSAGRQSEFRSRRVGDSLNRPPRSRRQEGEHRLPVAVPCAQREIHSVLVREQVQRSHVADAPRKVWLTGAKGAEHDLEPLVVRVERNAAQWVVSLLTLSADVRLVDFQSRVPPGVHAGEIREHRRPL